MTASLHALLASVFDYAGLFPPASLSLEQAAANFVAYRQSPEAWMLGRFICPVQRLQELAATGLDPNAPVSALARGEGSGYPYSRDLQADVESVVQFQARACCDTIEVRLSPDILKQSNQPSRLMQVGFFISLIRWNSGSPNEQSFLELPSFPNAADERVWRAEASTTLSAIHELRRQAFESRENLGRIGFKLRTGGLEAAAFPSPQRVAFVICACRDVRVCWKATAGLHHPLRHYNAGLSCHMHGFLNVLVASVLATVHELAEGHVVEILEDESPGGFYFDDAGLRWRDLSATTEQIAATRQSSLVSFGSCSFDEPIADLRGLGLLKS